jgi:hypothetical protein
MFLLVSSGERDEGLKTVVNPERHPNVPSDRHEMTRFDAARFLWPRADRDETRDMMLTGAIIHLFHISSFMVSQSRSGKPQLGWAASSLPGPFILPPRLLSNAATFGGLNASL